MTEEIKNIESWHKKSAVEAFNTTWDLIDKGQWNEDEKFEMIHTAHASRYHWGKIGKPINFERGEWQISRVYALLGYPKSALIHARRCLNICKAEGISDFDMAFALEAVARAYAVMGDKQKAREYIGLAKQAELKISEEADRKYFSDQLASIKL